MQKAAQRAIPVAPQQVSVAAPQAPAQAAPTTVSEQLPQQAAYPGELRFLHPTDYPNEPTTSGIDMGPGAGSEALFTTRPAIANMLGALANSPNASATLMDLASAARTLGL